MARDLDLRHRLSDAVPLLVAGRDGGPDPVSALLHAVAVVKAGVFTILEVAVYVFGPDLLAASGGGIIIAWVAGATILVGSLVAIDKDNL